MGFPDRMRTVVTRSLTASVLVAAPLITVTGDARSLTAITSVVWQAGAGGYDTYRIPSIVYSNGVLVALAEGRHASAADGGNIDIVAKRSTDGGATWGAQSVVTSQGADTAGNPTAVVDPASGEIVLLSCRNAAAATEAQIMQGKAAARRVYVQRSTDDGASWSAPVEITDEVRPAGWRWYATGPGHGVAKAKGTNIGRLVIPANHSKPPTGTDLGSEAKYYGGHLLYSDDSGHTWSVGAQSSNPNGELNENESTITELADGRLYVNARNQNGSLQISRVDGYSANGQTLEKSYRPQATIAGPIVEGSVIALTDGRLLYSGPVHPTERAGMTIRVSDDNGRTWTIGYPVSGLPAAYSDLVQMNDATIGLLYETGDWNANTTVTFARIPLSEVTG
ncbi:hypothetical protein Pmi06nite_20000 [Planotetraspora mira]|uniref:exo-alpha-sialidase n=1 Tax=Planotetraspora mira TaxID=58121 RepID=A0A8J3TLF1_9ACTN|nr:hypothetical protein Pmi06nite_20000 [Planotetraspora mira]